MKKSIQTRRIVSVIEDLKFEIDSWLDACDEGEIRSSFSGMLKASKKADKLLNDIKKNKTTHQ